MNVEVGDTLIFRGGRQPVVVVALCEGSGRVWVCSHLDHGLVNGYASVVDLVDYAVVPDEPPPSPERAVLDTAPL